MRIFIKTVREDLVEVYPSVTIWGCFWKFITKVSAAWLPSLSLWYLCLLLAPVYAQTIFLKTSDVAESSTFLLNVIELTFQAWELAVCQLICTTIVSLGHWDEKIMGKITGLSWKKNTRTNNLVNVCTLECIEWITCWETHTAYFSSKQYLDLLGSIFQISSTELWENPQEASIYYLIWQPRNLPSKRWVKRKHTQTNPQAEEVAALPVRSQWVQNHASKVQFPVCVSIR